MYIPKKYKSAYEAVKKGDIDDLKKHLKDGSDIDEQGLNGNTLLHYAASGDRYRIAALLIERKADINARNRLGETPLHLSACNNGKEILEMLISNGADVNARDAAGWTPLHSAALSMKEPVEIMEVLIEKGADVNAKDFTGKTPLYVAEKQFGKRSRTIGFLRSHGGEY